MTGNGLDLVILADDINNASVNSVPTIIDFKPSKDKILLPVDIFSGLVGNSPGVMSASLFTVGQGATTQSQRVVYDVDSGYLYYDRDGAGGGDKELIAQLVGSPTLSANNFLLG